MSSFAPDLSTSTLAPPKHFFMIYICSYFASVFFVYLHFIVWPFLDLSVSFYLIMDQLKPCQAMQPGYEQKF